MILAHSSPLPQGSTIWGDILTVSQPAVFDGWDFEGLQVNTVAPATVTRSRFHSTDGQAHLLIVSADTVLGWNVFEGGDLNGSAGESVFQINSGTVRSFGNDWRGAARDYVTMQAGQWTATGDRFGLFGLNCDPVAHVEVLHLNGGDVLWDGCMVDARLNGLPVPAAGKTGLVYVQGMASKATFRARNTPFLGAVDLGLLYPFQMDSRKFPCALDLRGCPIEVGIHGKIVGKTVEAGACSVAGARNVNAVTLQAVGVS